MNQMTPDHTDIKSKQRQLTQFLESLGPVAIAVSGGVDSMTLAVMACRIYPDSEVFHAVSPAVPEQATERVKAWGARERWFLHLVQAGEMEDPKYLANPANRCYYCKTNLYRTIWQETSLPVISGTNADDLNDYRPGLDAAHNYDVIHPYVTTGINKNMVRALARQQGFEDLHDLPAAPCLSSRVTTGIAIDASLLPLINSVEQQLWQSLGKEIELTAVRCRIRPGTIGIQFASPDKMAHENPPLQQKIRDIVTRIFTGGGKGSYCEAISIEPYAMGSAFIRNEEGNTGRIPLIQEF